MRKALLVATLVMASFGGGAAVNGPGLKWLKGVLSERLHKGDAIPTLDVHPAAQGGKDAPPKPADPTEPETSSALLAENLPKVEGRPVRPDLAAPPIERDAAKDANDLDDRPAPPPELPAESAPPADPPASPSAPAEPGPLLNLPPTTSSAPGASRVRTRTTGLPGPSGPAAAPPLAAPGRAKTESTADSAVSATSAPPLDVPPIAQSTPAPETPASEWPALRARMKVLGVSRYWVEGAPGGSVTFRCVVPGEGPEGASPQFEAEGEDEFQAAESALRRVAVWRAAQKVRG